MSDGWEHPFASLRRSKATLEGYQRALTKPSIKQWGTSANPCPTMMLDKVEGGCCVGFAFEFSNASRDAVTKYLREREGANFPLTALPVKLETGEGVEALVPIYIGTKRVNAQDSLRALISAARGTAGPCSHYAAQVARTLREAKIDDPILELLDSVSAKQHLTPDFT